METRTFKEGQRKSAAVFFGGQQRRNWRQNGGELSSPELQHKQMKKTGNWGKSTILGFVCSDLFFSLQCALSDRKFQFSHHQIIGRTTNGMKFKKVDWQILMLKNCELFGRAISLCM